MPPTKVNNVWGNTAPEGAIRFLTLPSGQTCYAKRMGLQGLVLAGVLAEGDTLTAMVDSKHIRRVRGGKTADHDRIDVESLLSDPESLGKILMMVDRSMPFMLVDPEVKLHFTDEPDGSTRMIPEEEREHGVYTDQVGVEDKMFLFDWSVGGTADAERFREESAAVVAGVEHGTNVSRPAKRVARRKG